MVAYRDAELVAVTGWTFDQIDAAQHVRVTRMLEAAKAQRVSRETAQDLYAGIIRRQTRGGVP